MEDAAERGLDWAGLPVIATVARRPSSLAAEPRTVTPAEGEAGVEGCPGPASRTVDKGTWQRDPPSSASAGDGEHVGVCTLPRTARHVALCAAFGPGLGLRLGCPGTEVTGLLDASD